MNIPRGGPAHNLVFVNVCEWLHRITGDRRYVEFARFLYDTYNVPKDVAEHDILLRNLADMNKLFNGHAAHVMEHLQTPFFLYYATGDEKYRVAVDNALPKTARHVSACGGLIGDEDIHQRLASPNIAKEHCTAFELLNSLQSAVQKTGRADWADWIERLIANAAEAFRLHDGKALQYFTTENQYEASRKRGHGARYKFSPTHEDVAVCCPPTATKMFPYFVNYLWLREAGGSGLVAMVYAPSRLETKVGDVPVAIETETSYPFEDRVRMVVRLKSPARFTIRLRLPAWSAKTEITAAGAEMRNEKGWKILSKTWNDGDTISVSFSPKVERKMEANGDVYWQRGPLVYALPIASERTAIKKYPIEGFFDWDYTPKAGAFWDYALDEGCGDFVFQETQPDAARRNWDAPGLSLTGHLFNRVTKRKEQVQLVPMAASILRRTTFTDMKCVRALQGSANLARQAKAEASSESPDFSARGVNDGVVDGYPAHPEAEWASNKETTGAKIKLTWDKPVTIEYVWLFDRPNPSDNVKNAWINFSDGSSAMVDELPNDGQTPFRLDFPEKTITWMEVIVTRVGPRCRNAGFSEIAVFAKEP